MIPTPKTFLFVNITENLGKSWENPTGFETWKVYKLETQSPENCGTFARGENLKNNQKTVTRAWLLIELRKDGRNETDNYSGKKNRGRNNSRMEVQLHRRTSEINRGSRRNDERKSRANGRFRLCNDNCRLWHEFPANYSPRRISMRTVILKACETAAIVLEFRLWTISRYMSSDSG